MRYTMYNPLEHITALKTRPLAPNSTTDSGEKGGSCLLAAWKAVGQADTHAVFSWTKRATLTNLSIEVYNSSLFSLYHSLDCLPLPARHHLQNGEVFMTDDSTPVEFSWDWGWIGGG